MTNIVVATIHQWNLKNYRRWQAPAGYSKNLIASPDQLTLANLRKLTPKYIFFPHWSWIVPAPIFENFECVAFHMTDLPFGRGGSPLQNLIVRGIYETKITAFKMAEGLDAGPVYLKHPLSLRVGSAQEIYQKASSIIFAMINEIITGNLQPKPQKGKAVVFMRRTAELSRIPANLSLRQLFDFVRMLDAPGYPRAFIEQGGWRFEFSKAKLENKGLKVEVEIKSKQDEK